MIGVIIAAHTLYPEKLIESISDVDEKLRIYIFFHGNDPDLQDHLIRLADDRASVTLFNYGINRGLARSWNEGIWISRQNRDEFTMVINDDLHFRPGGFKTFVDFARSVSGPYGIITVNGLETGASPIAGHTLPQDFACCIIGKDAIDKIGYFDTNFHPAYFEDMDFKYRMRLADLPILISDGTLVEHERSSTIRLDKKFAESLQRKISRNKDYYIHKWGGEPTFEKFQHPFDDEARNSYLGFEQLMTFPD